MKFPGKFLTHLLPEGLDLVSMLSAAAAVWLARRAKTSIANKVLNSNAPVNSARYVEYVTRRMAT